ncbi:hypothetical protein ACFFGH_17080 [Lysobacter korlensis]|uniref:DUF3592 domain-containing protein n=1 Tax=Lysobacter korlensis TaxID=553636 RepID=A0ABV6RRF0_9GAMM
MSRPQPRLPVDLTLLEGPRLASAVARVAPWTAPWRVAVIALAAMVALALNVRWLAQGGYDWSLLSLVFWVLVSIAVRELARAAVATRMGHTVVAMRVALRPRSLPAFHAVLQPGWLFATAQQRWRITVAGCGLQLGVAGALAALSPLWGGTESVFTACVIVSLVAWTALTGERAFVQRPPAQRGASVERIETFPTPPKPQRRRTRAGDVGLAWFLLLAFGVPGALTSGYGAWQTVVQEQRLRTARPVDAVVVATALVDRTRQRYGTTYRPVVRHRFEIDGRTHESERAHPLPKGLATDAAQRFIAAYPVGKRVLTHVPEGEPTGAYLVPVRQRVFPALALFGLLFLVPAVALWWMLLRAARQPEATGAG